MHGRGAHPLYIEGYEDLILSLIASLASRDQIQTRFETQVVCLFI